MDVAASSWQRFFWWQPKAKGDWVSFFSGTKSHIRSAGADQLTRVASLRKALHAPAGQAQQKTTFIIGQDSSQMRGRGPTICSQNGRQAGRVPFSQPSFCPTLVFCRPPDLGQLHSSCSAPSRKAARPLTSTPNLPAQKGPGPCAAALKAGPGSQQRPLPLPAAGLPHLFPTVRRAGVGHALGRMPTPTRGRSLHSEKLGLASCSFFLQTQFYFKG